MTNIPSALTSHPNVLMICVDQWPASLLRDEGSSGYPGVMAPTLHQLALNGTRFIRAYSTCPVCGPARRSLMTGLGVQSQGPRENFDRPMPATPTLAQAFRDGGYQTFAVGKLHVWPRRARIGFDEAMIAEEGRCHEDHSADDYELFLADQGFSGQYYAGGMAQNDYLARPWHLPEHCHPTHWSATQMSRVIQRRDPTRPALWYLSFAGPHPPLTPLRDYLDLFRDTPVPAPLVGDWACDPAAMPHALRHHMHCYSITDAGRAEVELAHRAFLATCAHIDHQIRRVLGTLAEEGLADNTIVVFLSDHGEMLGQHGLWGKAVFYERAARIPLIIVPATGDQRLGAAGGTDARLTELSDVMPTLLSLAGLPIPHSVEGMDLTAGQSRALLYGECGYEVFDTRMIRDHQHKLIYYPVGNRAHLFDLAADPDELHDLSSDATHRPILDRLKACLIERLRDEDRAAFVKAGELVGLPEPVLERTVDRTLASQRGARLI